MPGHEADVWGLGATLFHAVAGHRAFSKGDPDADRLERALPPAGRASRSRCPTASPGRWPRSIRAALDRNPGHRPLPSELADALEPVVAGLPDAAADLQGQALNR